MNVVINNWQTEVVLGEQHLDFIQRAAELSLAQKDVPANSELGVNLVDAAYIQQLNRQFRGVDHHTDVLAFPMGDTEPAMEGQPAVYLLGDVVISVPTAVEQAKEYGSDLNQELVRLVVHGTLHILGFDHEEDADWEKMNRIENQVQRLMGVL